MLEIKDLEVSGTFTAKTLAADTVTANMINGITPTELSYLKNSNGNIQQKLSNLTERATSLINNWR